MADRAAYDASTVDWSRLNAYARRVARQIADGSDYWVLTSRSYQSHSRSRGVTSSVYSRTEYCLTSAGELVVRIESQDEGGGSGRSWAVPPERSSRPFTDEDVTLFDFAPARVHTRRGGVEVVSDQGWDERRLLRHAKGVGVSKALKGLLDSHEAGRAVPGVKQAPAAGAVSVGQVSATQRTATRASAARAPKSKSWFQRLFGR